MSRLTAERSRQILDAMNAGKGLLLLNIPGVDVREVIKQALELALASLDRKPVDFNLVSRVISTYDLARLTVEERADVLRELFKANNYD